MSATTLSPSLRVLATQARDGAEAMAREGRYIEAAEFLDLEASRDDIAYTGEHRFPMMERAMELRSIPILNKLHDEAVAAELNRFYNS